MTPSTRTSTMRDVLIARVQRAMAVDPSVYFLTADLGAPALDSLWQQFPRRCINAGIAEQNLLSIAAGLALEGCKVFAYGIAPFVSMRACEQIRSIVALLAPSRPMNLTIVGLGAGFSYDVSGPSHQCIEDIPLVRLLPGIDLLSPADCVTVEAVLERSLTDRTPRYLRLDGKALPDLYPNTGAVDVVRGFSVLARGEGTCLVTTGFATHCGRRLSDALRDLGKPIGHVDLFAFKTFDRDALIAHLSIYPHLFTIEESLLRRGGLDSLVADLVLDASLPARLHRYGASDRYVFENGGREALHRAYGMDHATILRDLMTVLP